MQVNGNNKTNNDLRLQKTNLESTSTSTTPNKIPKSSQKQTISGMKYLNMQVQLEILDSVTQIVKNESVKNSNLDLKDMLEHMFQYNQNMLPQVAENMNKSLQELRDTFHDNQILLIGESHQQDVKASFTQEDFNTMHKQGIHYLALESSVDIEEYIKDSDATTRVITAGVNQLREWTAGTIPDDVLEKIFIQGGIEIKDRQSTYSEESISYMKMAKNAGLEIVHIDIPAEEHAYLENLAYGVGYLDEFIINNEDNIADTILEQLAWMRSDLFQKVIPLLFEKRDKYMADQLQTLIEQGPNRHTVFIGGPNHTDYKHNSGFPSMCSHLFANGVMVSNATVIREGIDDSASRYHTPIDDLLSGSPTATSYYPTWTVNDEETAIGQAFKEYPMGGSDMHISNVRQWIIYRNSNSIRR